MLNVCAYIELVREVRTFVALFLNLYGFGKIFILFPLDLGARRPLIEIFASVSELFLL